LRRGRDRCFRSVAIDLIERVAPRTVEIHGFDFLRERRIQGSSMGSNHFRLDMPRLVEFYMRGKLHLEDWISAKLKLSEINDGFANMKAGKTLRSVIVFDG
jgi:S-(hydroxymethyl)glutathione dehydrogenase / alcohol dehydrogenase